MCLEWHLFTKHFPLVQDAYQKRPLLANHDSSSDEDTGGGATNFGFARKKARTLRPAGAIQVSLV
jgi:hypothetical protein